MALTIIEQAKVELPATSSIGYAIPDRFAKAAAGTWGNQQGFLEEPRDDLDWSKPIEAPFVSKKRKDDEIDRVTESVEDAEAAHGARLDTNVNAGGWGVNADSDSESPVDPSPSWGADSGGWGEHNTGGWGSSGEEATNIKWTQAEEEVLNEWDVQGPAPSFFPLFGPVPIERSFTHQFKPVLVEGNLRSIEKLIKNEELGANDIEACWETEKMAVAILKPWKKPNDSNLQEARICEVNDVEDKNAKRPVVNELTKEEDVRTKRIKVLIPPEMTEILVQGMILGGIFVKLRQHTVEVGQNAKEWWYIEKLIQTLPSYYKELNARYINNLLQPSGGDHQDD